MAKEDLWADYMVLFFIMLIGAAEAVHLPGVFLQWPFSRCAAVFGVLAFFSAAALAVWAGFRRMSVLKRPCTAEEDCSLAGRSGSRPVYYLGSYFASRSGSRPASRKAAGELFLPALFVLLAASQIYFLLAGKGVYLPGDMTVETAAGFLQTDAVYQVNPMTGRPYTAGLPDRIAILCLPALYAAVSHIFRIRPDVLIRQAVPVVTLLCCYAAYFCLARGLFPEERGRRIGFLAVSAFLFWIGSYRYGLDGFGLLFAGWRGTTIRNTVLIPYAISLCLRKKYLYLPFCFLAEACIVWTFYGMGVCALVILGLGVADLAVRMRAAGSIRALRGRAQSAEKSVAPGSSREGEGGKGGGV